jgi:hypothetical protein
MQAQRIFSKIRIQLAGRVPPLCPHLRGGGGLDAAAAIWAPLTQCRLANGPPIGLAPAELLQLTAPLGWQNLIVVVVAIVFIAW